MGYKSKHENVIINDVSPTKDRNHENGFFSDIKQSNGKLNPCLKIKNFYSFRNLQRNYNKFIEFLKI